MSRILLALLCSLALCGQVFAAAAVLGLDLGTEYIKTSLVKPGIPLEIVLTKDSRRKETSAVAFKPPRGGLKAGAYPERVYGSDAMALSARFPGDVFPNLKTLLGLPVDGSPVVAEYAARHPALKLEAHPVRGTSALKSSGAFAANEDAWLVEELLAMELQSVRRNAEAMAGPDTSVRAAVITVPPFYTAEEKRAVELAAELAGLRVLSLVSDGLAVGVNYATSRQFPNIHEGGKPEINMVFDMGAGSTKATILKFQSRKVKDVGKFNKTIQEVLVLGSGWDRTLGGDTLNALILDDMVAQFVASTPAQAAGVTADAVRGHGRTVAKLAKEAERVRHVLSANTNTVASFEGLYADVDFRYKISRAEFDKMAEQHAARVAAAVQQALRAAKLEAVDLHSVILHGGTTRTPFVQRQLELLLGSADKLRSNVNSDEAAVFGAGFRAAELSPSFRVKEIRVAEAAGYPAGIRWTSSKTHKMQSQQLWTATSQLGGPPKEVTLHQAEDLSLEFYQVVPGTTDGADTVQAPMKRLTTANLTETTAQLAEKHGCDPATVQFKVSVQLGSDNGEVEVVRAAAECEADEVEKESLMAGVKNLFGFGKKEQQPLGEASANETESTSTESDAYASASSASSDSSSSTSSASSSESSSSTSSTSSSSTSSTSSTSSASSTSSSSSTTSGSTKKVTVSIPVKFSLEKAGIPQLDKAAMLKLKERLRAFEQSDQARLQREEKLNQLEAYTYKVRGMLEGEEYIAVSTEAERAAVEKLNLEVSEWLYGEGAEASSEQLQAKHEALREVAWPVERRREQQLRRPALLAELKEEVKKDRAFVEQLRGQLTEYAKLVETATSSAASTSMSSSSTTTTTDDFSGLEDDEPAVEEAEAEADSEAKKTEEASRARLAQSGRILEEVEKSIGAVEAWLVETEAAQARLGPQDEPVLTTEELEAKLQQVRQAALGPAMEALLLADDKAKVKGGKTRTVKAKAGKTKSSKTKTSKSTKTSSATAETGSSDSAAEPIPTAPEDVKHEEL